MKTKDIIIYIKTIKYKFDYVLLSEQNRIELENENERGVFGIDFIKTSIMGYPIIFSDVIPKDSIACVKELKSNETHIELLLKRYFELTSELQLANDGLHPEFKGLSKKGFGRWMEYVDWANAQRKEIINLRDRIQKLINDKSKENINYELEIIKMIYDQYIDNPEMTKTIIGYSILSKIEELIGFPFLSNI